MPIIIHVLFFSLHALQDHAFHQCLLYVYSSQFKTLNSNPFLVQKGFLLNPISHVTLIFFCISIPIHIIVSAAILRCTALKTIPGSVSESYIDPWNRPDAQFSLQLGCIRLLQDGPNASSRAIHLLFAASVTMEICLIQQTIGLTKYTFSGAWTAAKHVNTCRMPGTTDGIK